jgi:hypothetical protein
VVLAASGLQVITGPSLSLTVTRNIREVLPQELVAITVTGVVPLKKVYVKGIGELPILYSTVVAPETVTFEPSVTDALQAFKPVETVIFAAVRDGGLSTVIDFVALVIPQGLVTE